MNALILQVDVEIFLMTREHFNAAGGPTEKVPTPLSGFNLLRREYTEYTNLHKCLLSI